MSNNKKNFSQLLIDVIDGHHCVGCGTCVTVCPVKVIDFQNNNPSLIGKCIECGLCYENCPVAGFEEAIFEKKIFGRERNDEEKNYGVSIGKYAVKATSKKIINVCQDGGATTALLVQAIKEGFSGALVVDKDVSWMPKPIIATTEDAILVAAGTKYSSAPTLKALKEIDKTHNKLVLIGTPCQIRAARKIEYGKLSKSKIGEAIKLKLGLFCMETFDYEQLMKFLAEQKIEPKNITKFEIKKGKFIVKRLNEEPYEIKLSKMKQFVRSCCDTCADFTSEFADISIGNVGSPDGYSTVLTRTKEGEELLKKAEREGQIEVKPLSDFTPGIDFVNRLASEKKKRSPNV